MNVELSKVEMELLDEALKCWQDSPNRDGFGEAMVAAICSKGSTDEQRTGEMKSVMEKSKQMALSRERKAFLLRAKLIQALTRDSEHTIEV